MTICAVDEASFHPCMHHMNHHQSHHMGSGQDLYTTSMEFTQDYQLRTQQAPISPPETRQIPHRQPSVPYQEPCQNCPHPLYPFDSPYYNRQVPRQNHHHHHNSPVIQQSNTYIHTLPPAASSSHNNPFLQPALDTVTDFYNLYNTNVPTAPPVYFTNPNLLYPFAPVINSNQQQHQQNKTCRLLLLYLLSLIFLYLQDGLTGDHGLRL